MQILTVRLVTVWENGSTDLVTICATRNKVWTSESQSPCLDFEVMTLTSVKLSRCYKQSLRLCQVDSQCFIHLWLSHDGDSTEWLNREPRLRAMVLGWRAWGQVGERSRTLLNFLKLGENSETKSRCLPGNPSFNCTHPTTVSPRGCTSDNIIYF